MTDKEQKKAAKEFAAFWKDKCSEKSDTQTYWNQLLTDVFGAEKLTGLVKYEKPVTVDGNQKYIDVYIRHDNVTIIVEQKSLGKDLTEKLHQSGDIMLTPYEQAKRYDDNLNKKEQADYIITCNFSEFNIYDMNDKNAAPVQIMLSDLPKEFHLMKFLVGSKSERIKKEEQLSYDAGQIVGKMRDALKKQYVDDEGDVNLNKLCVRLVFCFYAEDAEVFKRRQFRDYLKDIPVNKWHRELKDLFRVLNTSPDERDPYDDAKLNDFPYVNGGLFGGNDIIIPNFTEEIADIILNSACEFDWSEISPTIFGAVFESTMHPETRRAGGLHYTSIENIHKVIDPLFLDELTNELNDILKTAYKKTRNEKLFAFQAKLASLKFLDPACGSGNFLTESYCALRDLENRAISNLVEEGQSFLGDMIDVSLDQFYGIEINDFAVAVAKTALWIAEIQKKKETEEIVGRSIPPLPLRSYENIIEGNALRIDWESVVPKEKLSYIMGNPPFRGASKKNDEQKQDIQMIFSGVKSIGVLDYVACWYKKASLLMQGTSIQTALVSTNSICQGEQVGILWKDLFSQDVHIDFAHRTFKWDSESSSKAQVHCVIVGFSTNRQSGIKRIYDNGLETTSNNISPYLINAPTVFIESRSKPICDIPVMRKGSQPTDGGNLIVKADDYSDFIEKCPEAAPFIKLFLGSDEFIKGKKRYCLWLKEATPAQLKRMPLVLNRVRLVQEFRLSSKKEATRKQADTPTLFTEDRQPDTNYIAIPEVSSENRKYIPIGFLTSDIICSNKLQLIPDASIYHFGVLTSNVHMAWMRAVAGRLEMRYDYSGTIVYNNFPWPTPTTEQKAKIEKTAQAILDARALYPDSSLADLYDELTMPPELRKAHQANDKAVMQAYGFNKDMTESEIVSQLMKMYQRLTEK